MRRLEVENGRLRDGSQFQRLDHLIGGIVAGKNSEARPRGGGDQRNSADHGENGTGKEMLARAIDEESPRAARLCRAQLCGATGISDQSELFGHEKGSFTSATGRVRAGLKLAEVARSCLDEVGDLSSTVQVKLLRVLQETLFERVGGSRR